MARLVVIGVLLVLSSCVIILLSKITTTTTTSWNPSSLDTHADFSKLSDSRIANTIGRNSSGNNKQKIVYSYYNVTDYGVIGDGIQDDTEAMRNILNLITNKNNQQQQQQYTTVILIPPHVRVKTLPLNLTSDDLTLQVDGELNAIDIDDGRIMDIQHDNNNNNSSKNTILDFGWPIVPPLPSYNYSRDLRYLYLQYQSFIYGSNLKNIRITGSGSINGNGQGWWKLFQTHSSKMIAGRPNLIQLVNCTNIVIDSITLMNSPFWTLHPVYSHNIHIHHITIFSKLYAPNVDGIDPDSCTNVLIEHNDISCGDDHISIKAGLCGYDNAYPNNCLERPDIWPSSTATGTGGRYRTENITVRHNLLRTGMGIAIGSCVSGGISNIQIYNNIIGVCDFGNEDISPTTSCGWGPALHLKTTIFRSGYMKDIMFYNNSIYNTSSFISVEMNYQQTNHPIVPPKNYPVTKIQNISFIDNTAFGMATNVEITCHPNDPCYDIQFINNSIISNNNNNNNNPWHCHYIQSYSVKGNIPIGLQKCMLNSMNNSNSNTNDYRRSNHNIFISPS